MCTKSQNPGDFPQMPGNPGAPGFIRATWAHCLSPQEHVLPGRGSTKLRISEFFGFPWQNLTEILSILPKGLQLENKAVIMTTSPLYNICLQQM